MINAEKIIELAEKSGAAIDYNSKTPGIGYTNSDGIFQSYTPSVTIERKEFENEQNSAI